MNLGYDVIGVDILQRHLMRFLRKKSLIPPLPYYSDE